MHPSASLSIGWSCGRFASLSRCSAVARLRATTLRDVSTCGFQRGLSRFTSGRKRRRRTDADQRSCDEVMGMHRFWLCSSAAAGHWSGSSSRSSLPFAQVGVTG